MRPSARRDGAFLFFDEIQEVPEWGAFLRRVVDGTRSTVYVTGSSSRMLSADLASEFRGRAISRELFPMGLLRVRALPRRRVPAGAAGDGAVGSAARAGLRHALPGYLSRGGFIAVQGLRHRTPCSCCKEYANRTVALDVIERHGVRNPAAAARFLARCLASSGRELSLNRAAGAFNRRAWPSPARRSRACSATTRSPTWCSSSASSAARCRRTPARRRRSTRWTPAC